jgi:hypothetical protein
MITFTLPSLAVLFVSLSLWTFDYSTSGFLNASAVVVELSMATLLSVKWFITLRRVRPSASFIISGFIVSLACRSTPVTAIELEQAPALSPLTCTSDRPTARTDDTVTLKSWRIEKAGIASSYSWKVTGGTVASTGKTAQWTFNSVKPGPYTAAIRVDEPTRSTSECSLTVIVRQAETDRGTGREAAGAFLLAGQNEAVGYGLYSYLLFGVAPNELSRDRYLRVIDSYLNQIPHVTRLEAYFKPSQLNITYLPVTLVPGTSPTAKWLLDHYDFARARFLLRPLPGNLRRGPYFVSSLYPLGKAGRSSPEYLIQDLSAVPPHLIDAWVVEFLNQSAQERFWKPATLEQLALKLRTIVGVLGVGLPYVLDSLKEWVSVTR